MKSNYKKLGQYIRQVDVRNTEGKEENLLGVSVQKMFIPSIANTVGTDFTKYKVVKKGQFTYIPDTSRRGDKIGIALLTDYEEGLVSNVYTVFEVIDEHELIPEYLMLWFSRPEFDRYARFKSHGSVREVMDWDELCKVELPVPTYEEQKRIVDSYKTITERIALKQKINDNLQQQAQAIFKEWFIDNPDNVNWSNSTFSELIQSTLSGDWGKEVPTGNHTEKVYCVRGADIPEVKVGNKGKMPTRYILPKNYNSKKLTTGDIVVEISGGSPTQSTGRCTAISESLLNRYDSGMVCTNFCRAIKPISGYSMFIYYYWQYLYDKGVFFSYENGTTGIKNLDIAGFLGTEPIVIPPKEKVLAFDDYCQTIFDEIFANGKESEQLSHLRDILLPKLISGELDVSDIEF